MRFLTDKIEVLLHPLPPLVGYIGFLFVRSVHPPETSTEEIINIIGSAGHCLFDVSNVI